jgi:hypothetical protein
LALALVYTTHFERSEDGVGAGGAGEQERVMTFMFFACSLNESIP